ncbi:MAG: class I SAM-dependent methyltransferase [Ignavibacteriae bacterium]|nr:MAG: class I SAM-dependent methyltransferase [Ignavibacteriota bacterium]
MDNNKIFEYRTCLLCGSKDYKIVYKGKTNIVKCLNCGLTYSNPGIREDVNINIISGHRDRDVKRYNNLKDYQLPRFVEELEAIERIIKPGKILDVGCGNGNFLECAKNRGWETYGVDINPASLEPCSNHGKIFIGSLHDAKFQNDFFDVVFSSSTFCYMSHPLKFLEDVKQILKPGGMLVIIGVPNVTSLDSFIKYESLVKPYPPDQVSYYFRKKDLRKIVKNIGLEVFRLKTLGFGISTVKLPEDIDSNSPEKKEFKTEIPPLAKAASKGILKSAIKPVANTLLNLFNLGYNFKLYCRKPIR